MGRKRLTTETNRNHLSAVLAEKQILMPSGCIEWTGYKGTHGYGVLSYSQIKILSHRAAYALANNIPLEFAGCVMHRCDNRPCINPDHLSLGTLADNNADMRSKGRHSRGDTHPHAKLTTAQMEEIRLDGRPQTQIASQFGISQSAVSLIKNRKRWQSGVTA